MDAPRPTSKLAADVEAWVREKVNPLGTPQTRNDTNVAGRAALDALVARVTDLEARNAELLSEVDGMARAPYGEYAAMRERMVAAEAQVAALEEARDVQTDAIQHLSRERDDLRIKLSVAREAVTTQHERAEAAEAQVAALTRQQELSDEDHDITERHNRERAEAAEARLATTRQAILDYCDACEANGGFPSTVRLRALAATAGDET